MRTRSSPLLVVLVIVFATAAACGEPDARVPPGTQLVANLDEALDPADAAPGQEVVARLAGNLRSEERVILAEGTKIFGTVTAVQQADERLPAVVALRFDEIETRETRQSISARVTDLEGLPVDDDGENGPGQGMLGSVVEGPGGAALLGPEMADIDGTPVALGTRAQPGFAPRGARLDLELTEALFVAPEARDDRP